MSQWHLEKTVRPRQKEIQTTKCLLQATIITADVGEDTVKKENMPDIQKYKERLERGTNWGFPLSMSHW